MPESVQTMPILQAISALEFELESLNEILTAPRAVHYLKFSRRAECASSKRLLTAVSELNYSGDGDSRSLINEPGVVFVSPFVIEAIERVNHAKSDFEQAEINYRKQVRESESLTGNSSAKLRQAFVDAGYPRLHVKQAARKLVHIDYIPDSLTWFVETKGWGKQMTMFPEQAINRLQRLGEGIHIEKQIELISSLPHDEPLAQRRKEAPRTKVREYLDSEMKIHVGSLPVFIMSNGPGATKEVDMKFDLTDDSLKPKTHSRSKFEENMVAPSLNLYRYKPQHRDEVREKLLLKMK